MENNLGANWNSYPPPCRCTVILNLKKMKYWEVALFLFWIRWKLWLGNICTKRNEIQLPLGLAGLFWIFSKENRHMMYFINIYRIWLLNFNLVWIFSSWSCRIKQWWIFQINYFFRFCCQISWKKKKTIMCLSILYFFY